MPRRPVREEPRWLPPTAFDPLRTVRRFLWGIMLILGALAALIGVGYLFSDRIVDRAARARIWERQTTPVNEQLMAEFREYPALSAAQKEELADTIAVVEGDYGRFAFELYPEQAPQTVQNFLWLVGKNFYDEQFLAGAEPGKTIQLDGVSNDPVFPYRLRAEFTDLQVEAGTVVLARLTDPGRFEGVAEKQEYLDSGSTRFMVFAEGAEQMPVKLAVFGKVIRGLEVVREMSLTYTEGLPDYARELLIYRVRLVPRTQLEQVLREPLEEPELMPIQEREATPLPPG